MESYQKVLSNTVSITRIQDSNLKIVQIYRLRGELEKSANRIQELIIDEDFNSIKSDLDLELTKIEFDRGKVDFAIQNYDRIGKDYPNTQTAIESYYLLSEIYLRAPNVDFEKVQFFMNESMRQNTNSPIKQIIDKRRNEVEKLIKLDAELKQLKDSERVESLFLAGQILAFNLSKYEESKMYFEEIVIKHQSSDYFPRSLFALYTINLKIGSDEYLTYRDKIISDYSSSDFAKYIINSEGIGIDHLPSTTLSQAEKLKDKDLNKSLMLYRKVINIDKSSDSSKIAAMGYCFGGLCVLDLARRGSDVAGVISFHGLFTPPNDEVKPISTKILCLHGYQDPMALPESVVALGEEMTKAGADWQLYAYGNALHSFTNPAANDRDFGTVYDADADRRSWLALTNFLEEIF